MSRIVATLVYSKVIGSAHRKAVLAYCADRASDDGSGVWCSKQTIAAETEVARSTVIKIINEFVAEGLLTQTGTRKCANGATVEYRVNVEKIRTLADVKTPLSAPVRQPDQSASRTSLNPDQSGSRTPPVRQPDPKTSGSRTQTVLEPSLNKVGGGSAHASEAIHDDAPTFRERILAATGAHPISGLTGKGGQRIGTQADMFEAARWLDMGLTEAECIAQVVEVMAAKRDGAPSKFSYFTPAMARLAAAKAAPTPQPINASPPTDGQAYHQQLDQIFAQLRAERGIAQ